MAEQSTLILIVDDEPDMCWALEHLFNNHGLSTQKALSGQEALNLMGQHRFACAFLDAKLPDMDGLELAGSYPAACPGHPDCYGFRFFLPG